jgi:hypothetical protein
MSVFKKVDLTAIKDIDPAIAAAFSQQLKRIGEDCRDRPGDPAERSVTLTIKVAPVPETENLGGQAVVTCNRVESKFEITSKIPTMRSGIKSFGLQPNSLFVFNPDSPSNINQSTFIQDEDDNA